MLALALLVPAASVEPVSDALIDELDALSVSVEDADAGTDAEQPLFGEPGMPRPRRLAALARRRALFADEAAATRSGDAAARAGWASRRARAGASPRSPSRTGCG